jgi:hypothetical protein
MEAPSRRELRELFEWSPANGVLSAYVLIDPGDRSDGWRIDLRERLDRQIELAGDGKEPRESLQATAARVLDRFGQAELPSGRLQAGFCEVTADRKFRDIWFAAQLDDQGTEVAYGRRPHLAPMVELVEAGAPLGVLAASAERVRLHDWTLGFLEPIEEWKADLDTTAWRERKAQSTPDPSRARGPSSSGHDQFEQRLDENRGRFLEQVGRDARRLAGEHGWRSVIGFGERHLFDRIAEGATAELELRHVSDANVINEDDGAMGDRVAAAVRELNGERERELVQRARDAALSSAGRGALGRTDTLAALQAGRAQRLLFDSDRRRVPPELVEEMLALALRTDAEVTAVEDEAAEALQPHDGVAALLRY